MSNTYALIHLIRMYLYI